MQKCKICGREFKTKRGLKVHMARKHKAEAQDQDKPQLQSQPQPQEIEELKTEIKALKSQLAQAQSQDQTQQILAQLARTMNELKEIVVSNPQLNDPQGLVDDAIGLVMAIANDSRTARSAGFSSGINTAVIKNEIERALNGQITFNEVINTVDNIWSWVKGYFTGDEAFQRSVREVERARQRAAKSIANKIEDEYKS